MSDLDLAAVECVGWAGLAKRWLLAGSGTVSRAHWRSPSPVHGNIADHVDVALARLISLLNHTPACRTCPIEHQASTTTLLVFTCISSLFSPHHHSFFLSLPNSTPPLVSITHLSCPSAACITLLSSCAHPHYPALPVHPTGTRLPFDDRQRGQSVTFNSTPPCLCPSPNRTTAAPTVHPRPSVDEVTRRMLVHCRPRPLVVMRSSRSPDHQPDACSGRRLSTGIFLHRKAMPLLPTMTSSPSGYLQTSSHPLRRRDL